MRSNGSCRTLCSLSLSGGQVEHGDGHWLGARLEDGHPWPRVVCQVRSPASQLVASVVDVDCLKLLLLEWQLGRRFVDPELLALAQQGAVEIVGY
jgi:hypothetical protein